MPKIRLIIMSMLAVVLMGSCSETDEQVLQEKPGAAVKGHTPVGFSAYARRGVTRSGYAGSLDLTQLEQPEADGGGFGVFAYYTDLKRYDQTYIPNFMYNQKVLKNGGNWEYQPVMYWPNESGLDAQSDDEDKVSFFAYAPYVAHTSAASGSVADATYGITGFSRNTTVGDPIVRYIASFYPERSVDLCWGVCASSTWARYQGTGNQTMTSGLPWLDVEHPQSTDQKMTFTFKHALSQLNVQIDADPDITTHDETTEIAAGTKIYVRSISFTGIATHGALNLNNTVPDEPLWLDYAGTTDLPFGQSVTIHDGRRDGREGAIGAEANNETPAGLNPAIVQNSTATNGVTHTLQNLFASSTATTPVYVIPTSEKMTVTIHYDVETVNPALSTYISDGTTNGVSIENKITKSIQFGTDPTKGLEAGKNYTLKLHLGMNSVKFDAAVSDWTDEDPVNGNGWLPGNMATDPPVSLSLGSSITMPMTAGVGTPQTVTATTKPAGASVSWTIADNSVATIAAAPASTRAEQTVNGAHSVVITPQAAGTTILTATSTYGTAQCIVTVTDENTQEVKVTLSESEHTMYATQTWQLTATTDPASSPLTWVSSNATAATVDNTGLVTASNAGLTYITVTTASGNAKACELTVLPTVLTLNKTSTTIYLNDTEQLTYSTTPSGLTVQQWSSDMTSVATVSSTGLITTHAVGTAHITATIAGGGTATCTVTVIPTVASVTQAPAAQTLTYDGASHALVSAGTAQYGTMKYALGTSSAPSSSYSTSIPTATNAGTYYVWYYAEGNGGFQDSTPDKVAVTVQKAAGTISFAEAQVIKTVGDPNYTQTATKTGDGSVSYSWTNVSGGSAIDSVTGEITIGTTAGTYTVTATVTDGTNYHYATPTATYTFKILPKTSPDATVTPGNWGGSENTDLTPDRNGL
ncbi:MAG: Ig-like domain-containing protein [Prevotella sp.]|nr:Ig-like domain-containing protein [Prevotella sp.]